MGSELIRHYELGWFLPEEVDGLTNRGQPEICFFFCRNSCNSTLGCPNTVLPVIMSVMMTQQNSATLQFIIKFLLHRDIENRRWSWFCLLVFKTESKLLYRLCWLQTQVSLNREKGKIMFEERRQSGGRQPHLHTLGLAQPFSCFCYCKTTEEQNFSANGSCCFCLSSDGSVREGKINHTVGRSLTFREKMCPVPNPALAGAKL